MIDGGIAGRARIIVAACSLLVLIGHGEIVWAAKRTEAPKDTATGVDLKRIDALVKGGAPHLALGMVERHQPKDNADMTWTAWERRRLEIYASLGDWDAITRRVRELPPSSNEAFTRDALMMAAEARLNAKDPAGARRFLRELLWQREIPAAQSARARRFVIRSYLLEGNLADAQTALLRYQQDYKSSRDAWKTLQGEILLRQRQPKAAFEVLAGVQSYEARIMRLAAGLRAGLLKPRDVMKQADDLAARLKSQAVLRAQVWLVQAEAAGRAGDRQGRVRALEFAMSVPDASATFLTHVTGDDLWAAYDRLAESIGNQARLVVGNDEQWRKHIKQESKKHPDRVRALNAFLATHARTASARQAAHEALAKSLIENEMGETLKTLYSSSTRYAQPDAIPPSVRYVLADRALGLFDIQFAAEMIRGLKQPPKADDVDLWDLRRARVLLYAGDASGAFTVLSNILPRHPVMSNEFTEAYSQVLFELQAIDHHREAIVLFESIYPRIREPRLRRENLYWIADSKVALGEYQDAAELYLRSATYNGTGDGDMWGQTARFHAAQALGKAGLVKDARVIYQRLLRVTTDPQQRAIIERNLQQLWLAEQKKSTTR